MSGIVGIFASIGDHLPGLLSKDKLHQPFTEGEINKCHYRWTSMLIIAFCIMVTTTEWIAGTDSIINCLHAGAIPDNVINNYCYISGTFSVPEHYVNYTAALGNVVSHTGVGPYDPSKDKVEIKAYYQWVPFMLFLQGAMFYMPHVIYKAAEGGKVKVRKKEDLESLNFFKKKNRARSVKTVVMFSSGCRE
jgi:hypothetical protein